VSAGSYNVINHTSSQRWDSVVISDATEANTFLLPDNGWYQVQNATDFTSLCEGVTQCAVAAGTYNVINHSNGQRYETIRVCQSGTLPEEPSPSSLTFSVANAEEIVRTFSR
jgi:hypothetical protein